MVSRVTILWEGKNRTSCRTYSVSQRTLQCVALAGLALLVVSGGVGVWSLYLRESLTQQTQHMVLLQRDLARQEDLLGQARQHLAALEGEREQLATEMEEMRILEGKIRRFLGVEKSIEPNRNDGSHQGGMGSLSIPPTLGSEAQATVMDESRPLLARLDEAMVQLRELRSESLHIPLILPVSSDQLWLSCSFGWRNDPFEKERREFHNGIDIAGPWKAPIISPADGTVMKVGTHQLLGRYVKIRHSTRIWSIYGHLATTLVKRGEQVTRGDVIGTMGNSGRSTGTHLHYSVNVEGEYVNPLDYVWERPFGTLRL